MSWTIKFADKDSYVAERDGVKIQGELDFEESDEFGYEYGSISGTHKTHDGYYYALSFEFVSDESEFEDKYTQDDIDDEFSSRQNTAEFNEVLNEYFKREEEKSRL